MEDKKNDDRMSKADIGKFKLNKSHNCSSI